MIARRPCDPRRGFTLVELLIAMVLLVMVGAAFWTTVSGVERSTRTQTELAAMHGAIRGGMQVVASDLQELYSNDAGTPTDSDIESMTINAITYKGMRGLGLVCEASTTQIKIRSDTLWSGLHDPAFPTDAGLLIFVDADETTRADDFWWDVPISAVSTGTCGVAADPAWVASVNIAGVAATDTLPRVRWPGAPVRTYERMELGLTTADGRSWLGIRSVSGGEASLVPLAGPVAAVNGVTFEYFQANSLPAATANLVKQIQVRLIGETERSVNRALSSAIETVIDTLTLRVELRNSR